MLTWASEEWGRSAWGQDATVVVIGNAGSLAPIADEVYATPQLFKDSWAIPMAANYVVIYTDGRPYYPTEHVFWNDYNIDPTYSFEVLALQSVFAKRINFKFGLFL